MFGLKEADDVDLELEEEDEDEDVKKWLYKLLLQRSKFLKLFETSPALKFRLLESGCSSSDIENDDAISV